MTPFIGETEEYETCPYHGSLILEHLSRSIYATCYGAGMGGRRCEWTGTFYGSTHASMIANAERAWRRHVVAWFAEAEWDPPIAATTVEGWLDIVLGAEAP